MNRNLALLQDRDLSPWSFFKDDVWDMFDRFTPNIEWEDKGNHYEVRAEVPGMNEDDLNVTLKENTLFIEGEKRNEAKKEDKKKGYYHSEFSYGKFSRSIAFTDEVDPDKVKASYKNGVLQIEIEKLPEQKNKSRRIEIKSSH